MSFYNLPEPSMSFCKLPWVKWIINRTQNTKLTTNYAQRSANNWSCCNCLEICNICSQHRTTSTILTTMESRTVTASAKIGYNMDTKWNIWDFLTQFRMCPLTRTASTKYTGRQAESRRTLCTAPCHAPSRRAAQLAAAGSSSTSSKHRPPSTTGLYVVWQRPVYQVRPVPGGGGGVPAGGGSAVPGQVGTSAVLLGR